MRLDRRVFLAGSAGAVAAAGLLGRATEAFAAPRKDVVIGVRLEPPHLDPTAGAAFQAPIVTTPNGYSPLSIHQAEPKPSPRARTVA